MIKIHNKILIAAVCLFASVGAFFLTPKTNQMLGDGFYTLKENPSLGNLSDVSLSLLASGDILQYDGSEWVNVVLGATSMTALPEGQIYVGNASNEATATNTISIASDLNVTFAQGVIVNASSTFNNTVDFNGAVTGIALNEIEDLETDKVFTLANKTLTYRFTNPAGGVKWEWLGAATDHLWELEQTTGDPLSETHLANIYAEDNDVLPFHVTHTGTPTYGYMQIGTSDTANGDIFRIHGNGNVGIGSTTPIYKLSVNGVISATGGISTEWNTAYSWGNHASGGYLKADGSVDLTSDWTIVDDGISLNGGTLHTDAISAYSDANSAIDLANTDTILIYPGWTSGDRYVKFLSEDNTVESPKILPNTDSSGYLGTVANTWKNVFTENASTTNLTVATDSQLGTITSGTWNGTAISTQYGGTGQNFSSSNGMLFLNAGSMSAVATSTIAGDGLTFTGTVLNFDGGDSPAGELGGTWASPTVDAGIFDDEYIKITDYNATTTHDKLANLSALKRFFTYTISTSTLDYVGNFLVAGATSTVRFYSPYPQTIDYLGYVVSAGTAGINMGDGTNWSGYKSASTSFASSTLSTNNSFIQGETWDFQVNLSGASTVLNINGQLTTD